ncbi:peptide ABC transporter substrate-binding protein [Porticoccaceae bacterium LTM1]|nr:peptide ABC transporter substrate-binding protein [Porticoccaceae bacterium LTM1]
MASFFKVHHRVHIFALLILTVSTLTLGGCGSHESNVERGNSEKILYWGNGTEPQELDPHITTGVPEANIQFALFEGLVTQAPKTLDPLPGMAESWSVSDDGKVYTFKIRKNARWSNGDPLTADDFAWSLWRAMHPKLGNQYSYMYYPIKNAQEFSEGTIKDFSEVGVSATDGNTLVIELDNATPYFLGLLAHHSYYPVHRSTIEAFGEPWERGTQWTRPGNMVTNGPFRLADWKLFKHISVRKNPYYYDTDKVALNGIQFIPTENITTEERMFRAGQLHVTNELPQDKIQYYRDNYPDQLMNKPYLGTYFYRINTRGTTNKALSDQRVRHAISMAINRDQITKKITKGGETSSYTLTPPGTAGYTTTSPLEYNPERARELLTEAGYPDGNGLPEIELLYNSSESHRKIAVGVQQMLKKELNIDVRLRNEDWKVYLASENAGKYQMSRASWIGDYLDPNTFLDLWITGGGNNRTGWSNKEFDSLILDQAPAAQTQEERFALMKKAEAILLNELPVIPIYTYSTKYLVHPSVKGLDANLLDNPLFKYMSLEDTE